MSMQPPWLALRPLIDADAPAARLQAVVMYVNRMLEAHWLPEELPRAAMVAYYVDCYADQVATNGIARFVAHCRWEPFVVACVREGLAAFASRGHVELFQAITDAVEGAGVEVHRALTRGQLTDAVCVSRLQPLRTTFAALEPLLELNARHLAQQHGIERLDPAAYETRMAALTALDATRRGRRTDVGTSAWAARTPQERAIRAWAQSANRPLACVLARTPVEWLGRTTTALHFQAAGIAYRAIDVDAQRVLIVDEAGRQEASLALGPFTASRPPRPRPDGKVVAPYQPVVRRVEREGTNWGLIIGVIVGLFVLRMILRAVSK